MINKVIKSLKKNGFIKTLKIIVNIILMKINLKLNINKDYKFLEKLVDINCYKTVIIFENNFGWNKIMKQRPQQIAENLPSDTLMFYHSHEKNDFKKKRIKMIKENLILIDLGYYRELIFKLLENHNNKFVMTYSTDYIPYEKIKLYEKKNYLVIYEYVDDINKNLCGDSYNLLLNRHKKIIKDNAMVICTASNIEKNAKYLKCKNTTLITNGVDYNHFQYKKYEIPSDLAEIKKNKKITIGYYGALAMWFDYELIKKLASNYNYNIVLIGQKYDGTYDKSNISKLDNVYYLGKKDYNDLPNYGCNIDIMIIPFLINDITKSTSPVKIFEYMAMKKPIVTTNLPECKKYSSVLISKDDDQFIKNVEKAVKLIKDKNYLEKCKNDALNNTWSQKASDLVKFVNNKKQELLNNKFDDILNKEKYERVIIWRSPFGWSVPLFQRPQHIARQFARKKCLVLYEVTKKTDLVENFELVEKNLYLVNFENPDISKLIFNKLKKTNIPKYVQIYSTNWSMDISELEDYKKTGFKILYEYIDDISPELAGTEHIPENIIKKYNYVIKHKDVLIVTTANKLYDDILEKRGNKNLTFSSNGVDYQFFQTYEKNYKFEKAFKSVIQNGKINICYYGALASWFDYKLIEKINSTNLYNILLFGIKYDNSYDSSKLGRLKNVYYFGPKDYNILKYYSKKMDILIIPFIINSITLATSPLKVFEYMAMKKPIVTTDMPECRKYNSVLIGTDHKEFIENLNKAYKLRKNKQYLELLNKEAKDNDWSEKADIIINMLKSNE